VPSVVNIAGSYTRYVRNLTKLAQEHAF